MRMTRREQFQQYLSYDPLHGILVWRMDRPMSEKECSRTYKSWLAKYGGKQAGLIHRTKWNTYVSLSIEDKRYLAHRVIAAMMYGEIPDGMLVDHIDGDGLNNTASNIRVVDPATNNRNAKRHARTRYKTPGIRRHEGPRCVRWQARIQVDRKEVTIGWFDTEQEAASARLAYQAKDGRYTERHGMQANQNLECQP